jgi:tRNA (Thr-GGU) A37 N-methylase
MQRYEVRPIGVVRSPVRDRVDDVWVDVVSTIELNERFEADAFAGLSDFSHAIVVYLFHEIAEEGAERGSRRPRNNAALPHGSLGYLTPNEFVESLKISSNPQLLMD